MAKTMRPFHLLRPGNGRIVGAQTNKSYPAAQSRPIALKAATFFEENKLSP